jgi:hypothetical protein
MWRCLRIWIPPPAWSRLQALSWTGTQELTSSSSLLARLPNKRAAVNENRKVLIAFVFDSVSQSWSSHETLVNFLDPSLHVVSDQPFPHFGRFCHQIRVLFGCLRRGYVLLDLPTLPASMHSMSKAKNGAVLG